MHSTVNFQVKFLLRAGVPIEKHATRVYTRALFERFFYELFRFGALICANNGGGDTFIMKYAGTRTDGGGHGASSSWNAMVIERNTVILANILSTLVSLVVTC
jgi:hypothetical protein